MRSDDEGVWTKAGEALVVCFVITVFYLENAPLLPRDATQTPKSAKYECSGSACTSPPTMVEFGQFGQHVNAGGPFVLTSLSPEFRSEGPLRPPHPLRRHGQKT